LQKRAYSEVDTAPSAKQHKAGAATETVPRPKPVEKSSPVKKAPLVKKASVKKAPKKSNPYVPKEKKDDKWLGMLQELKEYKETHGNCIVPRGYSPNPRLASWVAEQRYVLNKYPILHTPFQAGLLTCDFPFFSFTASSISSSLMVTRAVSRKRVLRI
jgi:hypothetical protein